MFDRPILKPNNFPNVKCMEFTSGEFLKELNSFNSDYFDLKLASDIGAFKIADLVLEVKKTFNIDGGNIFERKKSYVLNEYTKKPYQYFTHDDATLKAITNQHELLFAMDFMREHSLHGRLSKERRKSKGMEP